MRGGERDDRHVRRDVCAACGGEADRGVRVEDLVGTARGPGHRLRHLCRVDAVAGEQPGRAFLLGVGKAHRLARFEPAHLFGKRGAVASGKVEQQAFEVRADLDVHARRGGGRDGTGRIVAGRERAMQDVVHVGGDDQLGDGQAHPRRDIACEHVAEIPSRHRKCDFAVRRAEADGGVEIIDHLRHQPSPVDRIDRSHLEPPGEVRVVEHRLHHRLSIVEAALDRDVVDVGRQHRGHLAALHVAHPLVRVEHEDVDALTPRHRVDRGRAGVAAGRADDGEMLVRALEEPLEEQAKQLERDVLERERRAVKQLKQEMAMVELDERRDRVVAEAAISLGAQLTQLGFAQAARSEGGHPVLCVDT
eukprot:Opistho-1_new@18598